MAIPENPLKTAFWITAILFLIACSGCASVPEMKSPETFTVQGKARFHQQALVTGEITALRAEPGGGSCTADVGKDGNFSLSLTAGNYFLLGRASDPESGMELFSYWPNNPMQVYGDIRKPVVMPFTASTGFPEQSEGRGIRGHVILEGKPVEGAVVAVYLNALGQLRGQPYQESTPTDAAGEYSLDVPPGRFFILARLRKAAGAYQGPLLKGDLSGFYPHNPVILRSGEALLIDIPMMAINRSRGQGTIAPGEAIIVHGKVTLEGGGPVPGVRVLLYTEPQMVGRPAYVSSPTDDAGNYILEVPGKGTYYAVARSFIGGPPKAGDLIGFYEGSADHSVVLKQGGKKVDGIDITVRRIW